MSALKICPQCGTEYELDQRFCPNDGTTLRLQNESGDLVGAIVADRYHVLRKLGEGGMGQVYLAEHVKMGRKSALKVMNPGMVKDADAISRFNREAANASRINHANVAAVYDFGETPDGVIYLAMEFVDGPSLTKLIEQQGALPPLRAAEITRQAGEALAVAHDMGIVHRDLKPDNIMIAKNRDGSDCVKVVDFGIAKAADNAAQKVTKTGLVVGTPEYMSPEQLAGDKLDGRSDIYSLGLVAFNMLTGHLPFPAETVQESMIMRLTDRPKTLGEMRPGIAWPADVQAVLDRALQRDMSLRYQSAAEFGRDLFRTVERMPMSAVAEMGTQVIAPPPATRVAGAAPAGPAAAGGATMVGGAPPATVVAGPAAVAPITPAPSPAVTPAGKSRVPLYAAAAVILVAAAVGGAVLLKGGGGAAPGTAAATAAPSGSSQTGTPVQTAATGGAGPAPGSNASPGDATDVKFALDQAGKLALVDPEAADAKTKARQALDQLDKIDPRVRNDDELVRATFYRAAANAVLGNTTKSCDALKDIEGKSKSSPYAKQVAALLSTCP